MAIAKPVRNGGPSGDVSAADAVAEHLRGRIVGGSLPAGTRLIERSVAADLGVSHIPVREALARLEEEGLVEREPRRGARVAGLTRRGLDETSSLRALLEGFVVRRVQERWTAEASSRLAGIVERMEAAAQAGDIDLVLEQDLLFHEELWRLADHTLLLDVAGQLRGRVVRFFRLAAASLPPEDLIEHARSHRAIFEVIDSGDAEAAAEAMRAHIDIAARRIVEAGLVVDERDHAASP